MMREHMTGMLDLLSDRDAPLTDQIRASLAIFALHSTLAHRARPDGHRRASGARPPSTVALELSCDRSSGLEP